VATEAAAPKLLLLDHGSTRDGAGRPEIPANRIWKATLEPGSGRQARGETHNPKPLRLYLSLSIEVPIPEGLIANSAVCTGSFFNEFLERLRPAFAFPSHQLIHVRNIKWLSAGEVISLLAAGQKHKAREPAAPG
jgi:hypothetical protein